MPTSNARSGSMRSTQPPGSCSAMPAPQHSAIRPMRLRWTQGIAVAEARGDLQAAEGDGGSVACCATCHRTPPLVASCPRPQPPHALPAAQWRPGGACVWLWVDRAPVTAYSLTAISLRFADDVAERVRHVLVGELAVAAARRHQPVTSDRVLQQHREICASRGAQPALSPSFGAPATPCWWQITQTVL